MNYSGLLMGLCVFLVTVTQPLINYPTTSKTNSELTSRPEVIATIATPEYVSQTLPTVTPGPTFERLMDIKNDQREPAQTPLSSSVLPEGKNYSIIQPAWLNDSGGGDVAEILESGFNSSRFTYVEGNKGHYFLGSPYYHKLAALVSPHENILPSQNFSRWKGEGVYAEQDMAIGLMPGIPDDILGSDNYHTSLCGVLAVSTLVQEDPAFFIWESYKQFPWAPKMYSHPGYGTYESNMIDMLEWKGWQVEDPAQAQSPDSCINAPLTHGEKDTVGRETLCEWSQKMSSGAVPVLAANLMADKGHGVLVSKEYGFSGNTNAAHWVLLLQLVSSKDGSTYIRIYNPYQNREEWMLWDDLFMAWQAGPDLMKAVFYASPGGK